MGNSDKAASEPKIWTVSALVRMLKELLEQSFYPFWLEGEVSNLTIHRSGHVYFTLKDSGSQMAVVFFRGAAEAQQVKLAEGMQIEVYGRLTVYEPRGQCQLVIERLRPKGLGLLQRKFEELKKKLREEGLFDAERKRPIPALPRCIGVVTSPSGAAIRDFLQILGRRFAGVRVRICPTAVQGDKAAAKIVAAIEFLNRTTSCDVIVVTRGGGSLEDLWPFNEESVVRAVAGSRIPTISAVGHEVDFTLCDFAADLRVPTPSAAAEQVIGKKAELAERLVHLRQRLGASLSLRRSELRRRFERAAGSPVFREPANLVRSSQQRLDELVLRLARALGQQRQNAKARLAQVNGKLSVLNPRAVLDRGYAILLERQTEKPLVSAAETAIGARLRAVLSRGELEVLVSGMRRE